MVPAIALGTVACNVCVIAVLTRPHMRTPTNAVLMAIATAQTLCSWVSFVRACTWHDIGISVLPFNVMMFTMHGYESVGAYHLPYIWCRLFNVFVKHLPNIFHGVRVCRTLCAQLGTGDHLVDGVAGRATMGVRQMDAVQSRLHDARQLRANRGDCRPRCTPRICQHSFNSNGYQRSHSLFPPTRCADYYNSPVNGHICTETQLIGNEFIALFYIFKAAMMHCVPSILLVVFTALLVATITKVCMGANSC
jgi:hypothetical protein